MGRVKRSITAIQASASTPVNGATVVMDVSDAAEAAISIVGGTFAGFNAIFEASVEPSGDTNWQTVRAVRSNVNTLESTTGAQSAVPAYMWLLPVGNYERLRIRATALTSGSPQIVIRSVDISSSLIPAQDTQVVTLTSTTLAAPSASIAGASFSHIVAAASTNATSVKGSAARLLGWEFSNHTAAWKFVKIFNKATAPTLGTDTPVMTIGVPPNGRASAELVVPLTVATGLAMAITGAVANNDATAVAANDVVGSLFYV